MAKLISLIGILSLLISISLAYENNSSDSKDDLIAEFLLKTLNKGLLERLLQQQQEQDDDELEFIMPVQKRFQKWRVNQLISRHNMPSYNKDINAYGDNSVLRKFWEKNIKEKNRIYEKNNLI